MMLRTKRYVVDDHRSVFSGGQSSELAARLTASDYLHIPFVLTSNVPTVLMIAEKPKVAAAIADLFPKTTRKEIRKVPAQKHDAKTVQHTVHEFDGSFRGKAASFKVTSTMGHITTWDFKGDRYRNRRTTGGNGELFSAEVEKVEVNVEVGMKKFLRDEAKNCDYIVLWLDCDKAGESICLEVVEAIGRAADDECVLRANFSAISRHDIAQAMKNLGKINMAEALSMDALQLCDFLIGCSFTRFMTQFCSARSKSNIETISYGPCQTPALNFVVERFKQVQNFKPEVYYELECVVKSDRPQSQSSTFKWNGQRVKDKTTAESVLKRLQFSVGKRVGVSVKEENRCDRTPSAVKTYELLRKASDHFRILPPDCMRLSEDLYVNGKISYPRTGATEYKRADLETTVPDALNKLKKDSKWQEKIQDVEQRLRLITPTQSVSSHHPPVIPLDVLEDAGKRCIGCQTKAEAYKEKLHNWLVQALLASLSENCQYSASVVSFDVGGVNFIGCEGKKITNPGFASYLPDWQDEEKKIEFADGDWLKITEFRVVEVRTKAPNYMTVAELITEMEEHGIGTNGSLAGHIGHLISREYVTVSEHHRMKPTKLGLNLIEVFGNFAPELIQPKLRSEMEAAMNAITCQAEFDAVVSNCIQKYKSLFIDFKEKWNNYHANHLGDSLLQPVPWQPRTPDHASSSFDRYIVDGGSDGETDDGWGGRNLIFKSNASGGDDFDQKAWTMNNFSCQSNQNGGGDWRVSGSIGPINKDDNKFRYGEPGNGTAGIGRGRPVSKK